MKEILFLLLLGIIAFQKESSANPLLEGALDGVLDGVLSDEKKLEMYKDACTSSVNAISSYYKEQRKRIVKFLNDNSDCDSSIIMTRLTALDSSINQLKKDIKGEAKNFIKSTGAALKSISDNIKDLLEDIKKLSDDCQENLKEVNIALVKIETKCKDVRNAHIKVVEAFLKGSGLIAAILALVKSL